MATKPKTRKAPAPLTVINPKMAALAAKLDAAKALAKALEARQENTVDMEAELEAIYAAVSALEDELARIPATNLEELKRKARYVVDLSFVVKDELVQSIIRDLLAI